MLHDIADIESERHQITLPEEYRKTTELIGIAVT